MATIEEKIGFIGAGNMGEAIVQGLINSETAMPGKIWVSDVSEQRLAMFESEYKVNATKDNSLLFNESDVIVLAVKPQNMDDVLKNLTNSSDYNITSRKIIVSIAAGIKIKTMESFFYAQLDDAKKAMMPIFRIIPNTPALVLEGMSGMSFNDFAVDRDIMLIERILTSVGKVIRFNEDDIDAVTAISGSGPAYMFFLIELMMKAGSEMGLKPEDAFVLSLQTMKGAVKLMENSKEPPEELRRRVTSPGGTTLAALTHMKNTRVDENIVKALLAAMNRSKELSGK